MHLVHRTQRSVRSVRRGAGLDGRGSRSKRKANWLGKERILNPGCAAYFNGMTPRASGRFRCPGVGGSRGWAGSTSGWRINSSEPNNGWPIHGPATTRQLEFHTRYGVRKRIRHRPLFSAKRFHRVDPRSSPCRYVAANRRRKNQGRRCSCIGQRIGRAHLKEQRPHQTGETERRR